VGGVSNPTLRGWRICDGELRFGEHHQPPRNRSEGLTYLPSFRLDGKVVMVTGASQGLGRYVALAAAEVGADVALLARRLKRLEEVAEGVTAMGQGALCVPVDLTKLSEISHAVDAVVARFGRVDVLVNNAGTNVQQLAVEVTEEAWDEIMDLNVKGAFFTAQAVGRQMIEQGGGGRIINVASQMAEVGFYKRAAYCASKGALVQFSKVLAVEWAPYGVRVNCVGPTFIDSPLARQMFADPEIEREALERIPIGRLGRMEEVAAGVVYLASDGADLVTGHHLLLDGGWTAW
jgi:NAD(P)-dependent dehydrogenase (short-subunit alcohol dehydrogenase family)